LFDWYVINKQTSYLPHIKTGIYKDISDINISIIYRRISNKTTLFDD